MVRKNIFFIVFLVQGFYLFATTQLTDCLIYNGVEYKLNVNPMEPYFDKFPEKRPPITTSLLGNGYVATFEIVQNELWVIDIKKIEIIIIDNKLTSRNITIINECLDGQDRMKVDWFNGLLTIPQGNIVENAYLGSGTTYEYFKLMEIENGNYIREFDLNYERYYRYRDAQYEMYKQTDAYKNLINKYSETLPEEMLDSIIRTYSTEYMTIIVHE